MGPVQGHESRDSIMSGFHLHGIDRLVLVKKGINVPPGVRVLKPQCQLVFENVLVMIDRKTAIDDGGLGIGFCRRRKNGAAVGA